MNRYARHLRRGFTAVELLAALALASVLMVAVLGVIGAVGRTRGTLARHAGPNPWLSEIPMALRQDLQDGRTLDASGGTGGFKVQGYGALDPATLIRTHKPAEISYRVRQAGSCSVLVREQRTFDDRTGVQLFTQIVAWDVATLTLKDVQWPHRVHLLVTPAMPGGTSVDQVLVLE